MAALNASVKAAKKSRGDDHASQHATVHEMRPAKKTGGRTAPAKKKAATRLQAAGVQERGADRRQHTRPLS